MDRSVEKCGCHQEVPVLGSDYSFGICFRCLSTYTVSYWDQTNAELPCQTSTKVVCRKKDAMTISTNEKKRPYALHHVSSKKSGECSHANRSL